MSVAIYSRPRCSCTSSRTPSLADWEREDREAGGVELPPVGAPSGWAAGTRACCRWPAIATNDATAAASARRALALMDRRRARFYQGLDALYIEGEDLFLTMEGMGQWAAYLWLVDPVGGAMSRADALTFIRRGGRRWSQDEGLALLLALSRLDSASPAALFERAPATATMLLRRALTQPR